MVLAHMWAADQVGKLRSSIEQLEAENREYRNSTKAAEFEKRIEVRVWLSQ